MLSFGCANPPQAVKCRIIGHKGVRNNNECARCILRITYQRENVSKEK